MTVPAHLNEASLREAESALRRQFPKARPAAGLILGSGWGSAIPGLREIASCSAADIPGLGQSAIPGHAGRIVLTERHGVQILVFQGRRHWYEGEGWLPVVLPVFLMKALGARVVLLTNSSGGIRSDLQPGALVSIRDHLNLMGDHPLRGPHQPLWGVRFPDLTSVYHPEWRRLLARVAAEQGLPLTEGVYAALSGPSYETPAEVRMLAGLGADLVGMSTVPEAIMACACGLKVGAISCVTNRAAGLSDAALTHEEVLRHIQDAQSRLADLLDAAWDRLADSPLLHGESR